LVSIWFLGGFFWVVVLFSLSVPGNWGRSSWKCFGTTEFLKPAFAKGFSPSRKAPAGRDGSQATGLRFAQLGRSSDASFATVFYDRGIAREKTTRRPNLPDAASRILMLNTLT